MTTWATFLPTPDNPAIVGLGISLDEFHRMRTDSGIPHENLDYPLINLGLMHDDCKDIIRSAGLPVPPESSCWFCPFHTLPRWQEMRQHQPVQFWDAVHLKAFINDRRAPLGHDPVLFTRKLKPLDQVIAPAESDISEELQEQEACAGYCMM